MKKEYIVETNGLTKQVGKQTIVQDIHMHIEKGKIYGLLGRNGAGKTTIMKMLLGLSMPSSGKIYMFGKNLEENEKEIYPRIGSLIESPGFYPNLTGYENLKVFSMLKGTTRRSAIKDALEIVNLPYGDSKPFSKYSLGMKQRLGLANALMNEPELLILDEPTNGLDPIGIAELRELILMLSQKEGKTVLLSSHQLSEVEQMVDQVAVLHDTRLVEECDKSVIDTYNQQYIYLNVSDVQSAAVYLEQKLGIQHFKVIQNQRIHIYDFAKNPAEINRMLVQCGVDVSGLGVTAGTLEDHFKMITGGVGIA